jgi:beta-lactamase class A
MVVCVMLLAQTSACAAGAQDQTAGNSKPDSAVVVHVPARASRSSIARQVQPATQPSPLPSATPVPPLADALEEVLAEREGTYGMYVEHVGTGERFVRHHQRAFPSASVYKLAVAVEVLRRVDRRQLALDQSITIEREDAQEPEPEGGVGEGEYITLERALQAMLSVSSNAASHALMRTVGRDQLEEALKSLGLRHTRIQLGSQGPPPRLEHTRASRVESSPADMAMLLRLLARGEALTAGSRELLEELLAIPEPLDPLVEAAPHGVTVLSKTGELEDVFNVAGLVRAPAGPLIIVVLNESADPAEAREAIAQVAKRVLEHYSR